VVFREHGARIGETLRPDEYRFGALLVLILGSLIFQLAAPETDWARFVTLVLQGATVLAAMRVSAARKEFVRIAQVAVALAIIGASGVLIGSGRFAPDEAKVVTLLLVAVAPIAIATGVVRHVRQERAVTIPTMFGVLCIYLLIGMLFAFMFSVVDHLAHTPFFTNGQEDQSDFLYFSFTTITTTGYGDFVPATNLGHSLAIAEALTGQIYLVTVVAVIVGNLRPRQAPRDDA
jgi:drug/metabolite transporter (DMT)-like permease